MVVLVPVLPYLSGRAPVKAKLGSSIMRFGGSSDVNQGSKIAAPILYLYFARIYKFSKAIKAHLWLNAIA